MDYKIQSRMGMTLEEVKVKLRSKEEIRRSWSGEVCLLMCWEECC